MDAPESRHGKLAVFESDFIDALDFVRDLHTSSPFMVALPLLSGHQTAQD
jgi:hypothetical protein